MRVFSLCIPWWMSYGGAGIVCQAAFSNERSTVSQIKQNKRNAGMAVDMDTIVSLCKRRGFIFQSSEIYGGIGSTWDYGPLGVELKNNVKRAWWRDNVYARDDMGGLDAAILMHPKVWEASGHVSSFTDPLVDCKSCKRRFRADHVEGTRCPECGGELTE